MAIVSVYVTLIIAGRRKFAQVPKNLQPAVKADLEAMGLDENGNPIKSLVPGDTNRIFYIADKPMFVAISAYESRFPSYITISTNCHKPLKDIMNVLTHKQVFPYDLITSMFSFKEKNNKLIGIPKKSLCKDYLNEKEYTQEEYNSLVKTAKTLDLHSLLDIYKNYLECDVRLLIDVLDNFNKTMVDAYSIGKVKGNSPLWFYTISAYTRSMSLKYCEAVRND